MDWILLIITLLVTSGGFIASSYVTFADSQGWPIGFAFRRTGYGTILGGLIAVLFIILSAVYNEWWTIFILFLAAILLTQIFIRVFKYYAQHLAILLIISGAIWFFLYV